MMKNVAIITIMCSALMAYGNNMEPLGIKASRLLHEGKLIDAKKFLESSLVSYPELGEVIHWRLAQIAIIEKNYEDIPKILEKSLVGLLSNTGIVENLYKQLPKKEQTWLLGKIEGFLAPAKESLCPYFEMNNRKNRADLLFLMQKNMPEKRQEILHELYVLLPEAIGDEIKSQEGFMEMFAHLKPSELVSRIEMLLTFGQNERAHQTFVDAMDHINLSPEENCELKYANAKVDRKMRNYEKAKASFASIAEDCPEVRLKARYMELLLLGMQNNDQSLPKFSSFIKDYPTHSFTDDILLIKAKVLFSKARIAEAHEALEEIIKNHPQGDMIGRALFLQAMSYFKQNQTVQAIKSFEQLEEISDSESLDHASAIYWQARLSVFPEAKLINRRVLTKTAKKKLMGLIKAEPPTVYSWLSEALFSSLGVKVPGQKKVAGKEISLLEIKPVDQELITIKNLIVHGFKAEALILLDNTVLSEHDLKKASMVATFYDALKEPQAGHQKLVRCNKKLAALLAKVVPDVFMRISYPLPFTSEVDQVTDRVDVPKSLIYGIMRQESGFLPNSCSWAGAKGLMQLIDSSAKDQSKWWEVMDLEGQDLYHPPLNLLLASSLLKGYWQKFGNMVVALSAYNAGPTAAKKWLASNKGAPLDIYIEEIPFNETEVYVKTVLGSALIYGRKMHLPRLELALDQ